MASSLDLKNIISNWQNSNDRVNAHWSGTFDEYLQLIKQNPKSTRNAYQRMYDMIMEAGTEEYVDFKKQVVRYKFFDDAASNGKDAVFGLDIALMKLVNVLKGRFARIRNRKAGYFIAWPSGKREVDDL